MSNITIEQTAFKSKDWFQANNPILPAACKGIESDTGKIKVGNGTTPWNLLPYVGNVAGERLIANNKAETAASPALADIEFMINPGESYEFDFGLYHKDKVTFAGNLNAGLVVQPVAIWVGTKALATGAWTFINYYAKVTMAAGYSTTNNCALISSYARLMGYGKIIRRYHGGLDNPLLVESTTREWGATADDYFDVRSFMNNQITDDTEKKIIISFHPHARGHFKIRKKS